MLFNEPKLLKWRWCAASAGHARVSVLFNEPKLLKSFAGIHVADGVMRFSALQRAEIAEMLAIGVTLGARMLFQCSSTSRNC